MSSLAECWQVVEAAAVRLRGWDYPHVDHQGRENGPDWVASWVQWTNHIEYWRFFQSGQFIHHFAFWEDYEPQKSLSEAADRLHGGAPDGFKFEHFLDPINVVYTITEIFEFVSRLGLSGVLGSEASIEVAMLGTKDRVLWITDWNRAWHNFYRCTQRELIRPNQSVEVAEVLEHPETLAMDAVLWFFERFGWHDPPINSLRADQAKFRARAR